VLSRSCDRALACSKDWTTTQESATTLASCLDGPEDAVFSKLFERVLQGGGWDSAAAAAAARSDDDDDDDAQRPWVVLVTGLNGIRKTTSVNSAWFQDVLGQALGAQYSGPTAALPAGSNSFFRQLDYMLATLGCAEFEKLYAVEEVGAYARLKEAIFARYRTLAEMLGVLLVREAQQRRMNIMVETSGRDVGMYAYVEALFPSESYRKLVVNFGVNELSFAERSVDRRMRIRGRHSILRTPSVLPSDTLLAAGWPDAHPEADGSSRASAVSEMADGRAALATVASNPMALVNANAGGPYGSEVLAGVQADSQRVWTQIVTGEADGVGATWLKASVAIEAAEPPTPWRARAVDPAGAVDPATDAFEFEVRA
jgi:hypothetical protein